MNAFKPIQYKNDRQYLRELAKYQLELANLPGMQERSAIWTAHNDLKGKRPLVTVENRTFAPEIQPPPYCCEPVARMIEQKLLGVICGYLYTQDDRVVPDFYSLVPMVDFKIFGFDRIEHRSVNTNERKIGYSLEHGITDLDRQVHELNPSVFVFDDNLFESEKQMALEIFGDLLPVLVQCPPIGCFITKHLVDLMRMEKMMIAFYDSPDEMHLLIQKIEEEYNRYYNYLEDNHFLMPNNENILVKMGTIGYTEQLPGRKDLHGRKPLMKDLWGHLNSQETSQISPAMFNEFFLDSYIRIAGKFGLYTYGCCEPVDRLWDNGLDRLPKGLRKLSISAWCNEEFMGERLRESNIIYHRKPSAVFIGGPSRHLDEDAFRDYMKKTILAARGGKLEISMRDIYVLNGDLSKPSRAVKITRELIDEFWQP